jgi:two-component system cell cycle sensor histidine kinase/response regulator CckA
MGPDETIGGGGGGGGNDGGQGGHLRGAEARPFQTIVAHAPVALAIVDAEGTFQFVNAATSRLLGYTADSLIGHQMAHLVHPDESVRVAATIAACLQQPHHTIAIESQLCHQEGYWVDVELSAINLRHDDSVQGLLVTLTDLTRYRAVSDVARADDARARALFDTSMDAVLICDDQRRFLEANAAAQTLLHRDQETLRRMRLDDLRPAEAAPMIERLWQTFLKDGAYEGELDPLCPDGSARTVRFRLAANVTASRHLLVLHDLTDQRMLERQFLQAQKMEPLGRLAGGIAHDFNNLLTAIGGYAEFLADEFAENDPRLREVDEIRKAADRAAGLTRQLLAFSRKQVLNLSPLDLNAVVSNMDRMLRRLIGEDVKLTTVLSPELRPAHADNGQVEQVIINLAVNARDAMPNGGHLRLETMNRMLGVNDLPPESELHPGEYVMLAISDTGVGMSPQTKAHLFEPFYTTKDRGRGTGLGLSTVYGIVKQCGGHITVSSEVDRGTTFCIFLPVAKQPAEAPEEARAPAAVSGGSETILVVEDDPSVLGLTCEALERRGYRVLTANGWLEALDLVSRSTLSIDLVLTDIIMPGMGGRVLGERIRLLRPQVRVLYMSGYPDDAFGDTPTGGRHPPMTLLEKPFTAERLAVKIREILDHSAS